MSWTLCPLFLMYMMYTVVGNSALGVKNVPRYVGDSLSCKNWSGLVTNVQGSFGGGDLYHGGMFHVWYS